MDKIQLNTITSYQIGSSVVLIKDYVRTAKEFGYKALACCDDSMRAFPELSSSCEKEGIKPIFGYKIKLKDDRYRYTLSLFIKDEQGYKNICLINSLKVNELKTEELQRYRDGLIAVIDVDSDDYFYNYYLTEISKTITKLRDLFEDDLYFGLRFITSEDKGRADDLFRFLKDNDYKSIAFPQVRYLKRDDAYTLKIVKAHLTKEKIEEEKEIEDIDHLLSDAEIEDLYTIEEIDALEELVNKIDFKFFKSRGSLIKFDDDIALLKEKSYKGLDDKIGKIDETYKNRLDYELKVIEDLNFSSYFLLVSDYVNYAKRIDIKVGPSRGSAGGSLVAYSLNITEIDPIKYDLSFERFLNPKRQTMPDIDVDFQDDRRDEVERYLIKKYGEKKVCKIITYVKIKPKSALQVISNVFSIDPRRIKKLSSCIADDANDFKNINKDVEQINRFKSLVQDPYYKDIVVKANKLLNLPISTSVHAPGLIIADKDIYLSCPMSDKTTGIAQFEYQYMEQLGFLKVDILPLSTLSYIFDIEKRIENDGKRVEDIQEMIDDKKTYQFLRKKYVQDIFQLDASYGIRLAIEEIQPSSFIDLAALLALYRPGPIDYIHSYADRKNNREEVKYKDPRLIPILKSTYGIMVYQEQVMKAIMVLADFDAGDADLFRRAISKKDRNKMIQYKDKFIVGCISNGIDEDKALDIYEDIEKFADYGFNKSHAYSYALISLKMLYLKAHHSKEFYQEAFIRTSYRSPSGQRLLKELSNQGYVVHLPDINLSDSQLLSFYSRDIYLPLIAIDKMNKNIADELTKRRGEKYISIYDFCLKNSDLFSNTNSSLIDNMIDAGVFDSFIRSRKSLENSIKEYIDYASMHFDEKSIPNISILKDDIGEYLLKEKTSVGFINSYKKIFHQKDFKLFIISDVSSLLMNNIIQIEDENRTYIVKIKGKKELEKYGFISIPYQLLKQKGILEIKSDDIKKIDKREVIRWLKHT